MLPRGVGGATFRGYICRDCFCFGAKIGLVRFGKARLPLAERIILSNDVNRIVGTMFEWPNNFISCTYTKKLHRQVRNTILCTVLVILFVGALANMFISFRKQKIRGKSKN